jgi:hypothetical protein
MIDLHSADADTLIHSEAIKWLEAAASESQRVEFKEIFPDLDKVAESACAFANAYGGIIVIGFVDPGKTNGQLVPTARALDFSDKALLRINNTLIDRVRPGFWFDIVPLTSVVPHFAVIRVKASSLAPHEVLPSHQFPVRRGRRDDRLSLPEIEMLIRRRDGIETKRVRWIRAPAYPNVVNGPGHSDQLGSHVAVSVAPVHDALANVEHGRDDDEFVMEYLRVVTAAVEGSFVPDENGIFYAEATGDMGVLRSAPFVIEVDGSGVISARLKIGYRQGFLNDVEDLANLLATVYNLAARLYKRKRFGPLANVSIVVAQATGPKARTISSLPAIQNLTTTIDLSMGFGPAFSRFVERIWRSAGSNPTSDAVEGLLLGVWDRSFKRELDPNAWYAK